MAKQGKKLTYRMKVFLEKIGVKDIDDWGYVKNTNEVFLIRNKITNEEISYKKDDYNITF